MKLRRIILCFLMIISVSFGASLTLKASIGVGAWDALSQTGSSITNIQVGTVGMFFNLLCILIQLVILKRNFKITHAMQIVLSFILGYTINFFFYNVLGDVELTSYASRVVFLIAGYVLNAFTVATMMLIDVVTFSLEGACKAISDKTGMEFHKFRQAVDVFCIVIVLIMSFTFDVPLAVREGTVIGMIIFGPIMGMFMRVLKPIYQKYDLAD